MSIVSYELRARRCLLLFSLRFLKLKLGFPHYVNVVGLYLMFKEFVCALCGQRIVGEGILYCCVGMMLSLGCEFFFFFVDDVFDVSHICVSM